MSASTNDIRKRLSEALEEYDDRQADKAMSSGKPRSWNPNALRIYLQQVNYIMDDIEKGADPRSAITAGMTGSVLSYVLRKLKMRPPSRDEYTGAGRMVYRPVSGNPPMYAHHLRERKTHGMNLKQMRRLYAMVSRGSQKAITFARNVLGIPFDETPSQVKAVVKHHVLDLAERRVRKNPAGKQGWALVRGGGPTGMKMVVVSIHKTREGAETAMTKKGAIPNSQFTKGYSIHAFGPGTRYEYLDSEFTGKFLRPLSGNPDHQTRIALQTVRRPMEGYFLGGPDLEESVRLLLRRGYTMAQLRKINPDVEDFLAGRKSILPNRRRRRK